MPLPKLNKITKVAIAAGVVAAAGTVAVLIHHERQLTVWANMTNTHTEVLNALMKIMDEDRNKTE